jgi:hypothetical protein
MVSWHGAGIALGALAGALTAFLTVDPNPDGAAVNRALAGFAVAALAGSMYLLHYYPAEAVAPVPSPPQQAP